MVRKYFRKQKKRFLGWAKKRYLGRQGIANVVKDVSMLKNLINTEFQYKDTTGISQPTVTAPVISPMIDLSNGNGVTARKGNQIKMKSIQCRMRIERNPGGATPNANMIRWALVLDQDPLLGVPAITDIYVNSDPDSLRNIEGEASRRFRVLASRTWLIDGVNTKTAMLSKYLKVNIPVRWRSASQSDISHNNLYWVLQTDNTIIADLQCSWGYRIRYVDN